MLVFATVLLATTIVATEISLVGGRATVTLPNDWKLAPATLAQGAESIRFDIPYTPESPIPVRAHGVLIARRIDSTVSVQSLGDRIYRQNYEAFIAAGDVIDGRAWRSILWSARTQVPYIMMDRFGVGQGVAVELLVALPLVENGDVAKLESIIASFNEVIGTLLIDGRNDLKSRYVTDRGSVFLRAGTRRESSRLELTVTRRKATPEDTPVTKTVPPSGPAR